MIPDILLLLAIVSGFLAGLLIGLAVWHRTRSASQIEREEFKVRIATLEKEREADMGKYLKRSVEGYNRALGSLDKRLIPAVRRFQEMGLSTTQLDAPPQIEVHPTLPSASEERDR